MFRAFNLLVAVTACSHSNVRFDPPYWYAFIFTTVEPHSVHHTVGFAETRCNYANSLIVIDLIFGTFRDGEAAVVGQDDRKRLSIWEQFTFPLRALRGNSAPAAR